MEPTDLNRRAFDDAHRARAGARQRAAGDRAADARRPEGEARAARAVRQRRGDAQSSPSSARVVTGVDPSDEALDAARERWPSILWVAGRRRRRCRRSCGAAASTSSTRARACVGRLCGSRRVGEAGSRTALRSRRRAARLRGASRRGLRRRAAALARGLLRRARGDRPGLAARPGRDGARARRASASRRSRSIRRNVAATARPPRAGDVPAVRASRVAQPLERLVELGVRDRQRRRGLDQLAVAARRDQQHAAIERVVGVAFACAEEPAAAPALALEPIAGREHAVEEPRCLVEHDEHAGARERIADVRVRVHVLRPEPQSSASPSR